MKPICPEYTSVHVSQVLRNEPDDFEALCPECGQHIFIVGGKMIVQHVGDFFARHQYPCCTAGGFNTMQLE